MIERLELEMERIFSYAVALEQLGRQRNTIHCWENIVYILNSDKTTILRFESSQNLFKEPISFYANDYDSPLFTVEGSSIVFLQRGEEFLRKKKCRIPGISFSEVESLFYKFYDQLPPWKISFHKSSLDLLNDNLSHVEFVVRNEMINILQRDIYAGTLIRLERKLTPDGLGLMEQEDVLPDSIEPIGMRTSDFLALFGFNEKIDLYFPEGKRFFMVEGAHNKMSGVVAGCLYDNIGTIDDLQEEEDGRKIEKERASEQEVGREDYRQILRRRK